MKWAVMNAQIKRGPIRIRRRKRKTHRLFSSPKIKMINMISSYRNTFDFYKRITKRTEMMFYFDFDHFSSLSIQILSTSFDMKKKNCVI